MIPPSNVPLESIERIWKDIFDHYGYTEKIVRLKDFYPDEKSLIVSFRHISDYSNEFAELLINNPLPTLKVGENLISSMIEKSRDSDSRRVNLRLVDLPDRDVKVGIRDIRSDRIGKIVSISGIIRKRTDVTPRLQNAVFQCSVCAELTIFPQQRGRLEEPPVCSNPECGADRQKAKFKLIDDESEFVDVQKLEIQENPETLEGGAQPQRITVVMEDDITGSLEPGDRVIIDGVLLTDQKRIGAVLLTEFSIYVYCINFRREEKEVESLDITPEDIEEIKRLASRQNIVEDLARSIAPTIYGMDIIKQTLVLQMFGGVRKIMEDGTTIRGDIHILLVGDPGTAKSQLLRYMSEITPRGIFAMGKGSSSAGLTAAAVRDDFGEGRWTLEAGVLVLANDGLAAIDELDKMEKFDTASLHEAMEQQSITISKAGIYATLSTRCSILAAANPDFGRLDPSKSIVEQLKNFPLPLLSRFDIIFRVADVPSSESDTRLADHILKAHRVGEELRKRELTGFEGERLPYEEEFVPVIPKELLKKYVAYAKKSIFPGLSEEAMEIIRSDYVRTRNAISSPGVPITARQLESIIRLAEASARARLSDIVTAEDAIRAKDIVKYYLSESATEEGVLDADIVMTGMSGKQRTIASRVKEIIEEMGGDRGIDFETLKNTVALRGVTNEQLLSSIKTLKSNGFIYSPRDGVYKVIKFDR